MPRYSYVVAFPVLIAICVGVNIQRYPAVSAMLQGESVESRWLGRSEVFDFQAKPTGESKSYQGYRSDSDHVTDSRASRQPIPLSDSLSTPVSSVSSSQSSPSSRSTPVSQSGVTDINTTPRTSTGSTERDNYSRDSGSYGSDFYKSRSGDVGSTGTTDVSSANSNSTSRHSTSSNTTGNGSYSYSNQNDPYSRYSDGGGNNGLTDPYSSSPDPYNGSLRSDSYSNSYSDSYKNSYNTSSSPSWNEERGNYDKQEERNDNIHQVGDRSESSTSSDDRYPRPGYQDSGNTGGNSFRMDSPLPGYSNQYPATDEASSTSTSTSTSAIPAPTTPTAAATSMDTAIVNAATVETESAAPLVRRTLSVQEKLELRLATPFSFTPSSSQDASSGQYIPPDFLPPHENGIVGKLVNPSTEPVVAITPVTFISGTTSVATPSDLPETTATSSETDGDGEIIP